ncbi:tetratricopeptide repeat protein [Saccharothrix carnea]|uniref:Tetratricopeptide repeat protein n=1 Tax=Saccharothrix carnea TaxID=1280637 RepID=A0A2P8HZ94_SACCR|nr:tetratricopeptide repeat protein [Saccharothrix carnea]PSL51550.1 tetratricopeptide repeat protein [Saccharothrix carnea]
MTRRRIVAVLAIVAGAALLVSTASALTRRGGEHGTPGPGAALAHSGVQRTIAAAQEKLRRSPRDAATWALLGSSYVEQARVTGDPSYYAKAQGALTTSLEHQPVDNGPALLGLGALANARHDFSAARDFAERARSVLPDTAEVYGVLADALTQLGAAAEATAAVQRMLDLEPGVASFTRAAYDLEQRGDVDAATHALERALESASTPADTVFCRYHLGELAWDNGDPDLAAEHYERGLSIDPQDVTLLRGKAKVAAARGRVDEALAEYADIVRRVPAPHHLHEYATLLRAHGRHEEAAAQTTILSGQFELLRAAGGADDLAESVVAADQGRAAQALRLAEAEWGRRQHALVADALAWALHLNGRHAEALALAERATASGWRHAGFAFHRGMILASLGRTAEAAAALDEALRINPHFSFTDAAKARDALAGLR